MKENILLVVFCFSINPFIKKQALINLSSDTGYALVQTTTTAGNLIYLILNSSNIQLKQIKYRNINSSIISSLLTILSSYKMNELIKKNNISNLNAKIQVLTIIMSYIIDHQSIAKLNTKQILGLGLMLAGMILTKLN